MDKETILEKSQRGLLILQKLFNGNLKKTGKSYQCLNYLRGEKNPSLIWYKYKDKWRFKDMAFPDEYKGDIFNWIALEHELNVQSDFVRVLEIAQGILEDSGETVQNKRAVSLQSNQPTMLDYDLEERPFSDIGIEYWESLLVSEENLIKFGVKQISGFTMKYSDGSTKRFRFDKYDLAFAFHGVNGVKVYSPKPKKFFNLKTAEDSKSSYRFQLGDFDSLEYCIVTAGEKDAVVLHALTGLPVVCFNSETSSVDCSFFQEVVEKNENVMLFSLFDCDKTGENSASKLHDEYGIWPIKLNPHDYIRVLHDEDDPEGYSDDYYFNEFPCNDHTQIKDVSDIVYYRHEDTLSEKLDEGFAQRYRLHVDGEEPIEYNFKLPQEENSEVHEEQSSDEGSNQTADSEQFECPSFDEKITTNLPKILMECIEPMDQEVEKDALLIASIVACGSMINNIYGVYAGQQVEGHLNLFVTAPASSGKSCTNWVVKMLKPLQELYDQHYEKEVKAWNEDKDNDGPYPKLKHAVIGGDTSTIKLGQQMFLNDGRSFIFESEGDVLANAWNRDYSQYSPLFRQAYSYERISFTRKDDRESFAVEFPRLSSVLAGTLSQIVNLIPSSENGLFSRFIYFKFQDQLRWKNVFGFRKSLDEHYHKIGRELLKMHLTLRDVESSIQFRLTADQETQFQKFFSQQLIEFNEDLGLESVSIPKRMGNNCFRIALILSVIRSMERDWTKVKELVCTDQDFDLAMNLIKVLVKHAEEVFKHLPQTGAVRKKIKAQPQKFLDLLPDQFNRAKANEIADSMNLNRNTADRYLRKFKSEGLIESPKHNFYKKVK